MKKDTTCRHYDGLDHATCKAGVQYATVQAENVTFYDRWPCFGSTDCPVQCEQYAPHTAEELAERDRKINEFMNRLTQFEKREIEDCPHCGKHVISMRKVGRCVYGSCGCRLWQGNIPDAWK